MRVVAWNVNHRAARRHIPPWVADAIGALSPDVLVLTEYVEGPGHADFVAALAACRLCHVSVTTRPGRENQVMIASREEHRRKPLDVPTIHPSVPSNALEVTLGKYGVTVLGFRMPAFTGKDRARKRETWDWLQGQADRLRELPALIAGDFNTALGDSDTLCSDCLDRLRTSGWELCGPPAGDSWHHPKSGTSRQIDHVFTSRALVSRSATYSWDFERTGSKTAAKVVGSPDHAMLVVEVEQA